MHRQPTTYDPIDDTQPLYDNVRQILHDVSDVLSSVEEAYFSLEGALEELRALDLRLAGLHDLRKESDSSETSQP
jgi:hypothetical protein